MENRDNEFEEVRFDDLHFSDLENEGDSDNDVSYYFRDPIVKQVVDQFVSRSDVGYNKYGQTLDSERREGVKNLGEYLQDVQEELMDAILYIQAAKEDLACTPQCKCQVKDVESRAKTTIGDLTALQDLKDKMLLKKVEKNQLEWARKNYPNDFHQDEQVTYDKDNFGYTKSFYGNDYASDNT